MPLKINSLEDLPHMSAKAREVLLQAGVSDVPVGRSTRGQSTDYLPLSFSDLRKEEARTLIAVYQKLYDMDDGSAPERPLKLIKEAMELIEARLAELGRP